MSRNQDYSVGYKRPPKSSQFRKGRSGNPSGRPKRKNDFLSALSRVLRQPISIEEQGQRRQVSKLQAIVIRLINRAAAGDLAAINTLSRFQIRSGGPVLESLGQKVEVIVKRSDE